MVVTSGPVIAPTITGIVISIGLPLIEHQIIANAAAKETTARAIHIVTTPIYITERFVLLMPVAKFVTASLIHDGLNSLNICDPHKRIMSLNAAIYMNPGLATNFMPGFFADLSPPNMHTTTLADKLINFYHKVL